MYLNATLIVQAIHFLLAYLIIRQFFLKPAVRALNEDKHELELLEQAVTHGRLSLEHERGQREGRLKAFKAYLGKHIPVRLESFTQMYRGTKPHVAHVPLSQDEREQLVKQLQQVIVQRISEHQ